MAYKAKLPINRFVKFVAFADPDECWEWQGEKTNHGYGRFWVNAGYHPTAHRWIYQFVYGDIPDDRVVDHQCFNRSCVNPGHLKAMSQQENLMRSPTIQAANAQKTVCPKGHPYDYVCPKGKRGCRTCRAEQARNYAMKVG